MIVLMALLAVVAVVQVALGNWASTIFPGALVLLYLVVFADRRRKTGSYLG